MRTTHRMSQLSSNLVLLYRPGATFSVGVAGITGDDEGEPPAMPFCPPVSLGVGSFSEALSHRRLYIAVKT
jgi:hypothetical protein